MMESAAQAHEAVRFTRYPPEGCRGAAFTLSHDDYQPGDVGAKMRSANEERLLVALIETVQGVERADEIAAVDGLDVLWIGQFDLTNSMGIPGQFTHPDFHRAVARVLEACQRHGKAGGFGSLDLAELQARREQGFRFLVYTADVWIYQQALRQGMTTVRDRPGLTWSGEWQTMDLFDVSSVWQPWRERTTTSVDCLPFHAEYPACSGAPRHSPTSSGATRSAR